MLKQTWEEGRFLKWLHRDEGIAWGTDPGEYDPEAVKRMLPWVKKLFGPGRYFGVEVEGWRHVPEAPVMIVSNHSGGTTIPDVWGFMGAWYQNYGVNRPLHPMAHEIILSTQRDGRVLRAARRAPRQPRARAPRAPRLPARSDRDARAAISTRGAPTPSATRSASAAARATRGSRSRRACPSCRSRTRARTRR